jgi:microcystin degradation protein MlrC
MILRSVFDSDSVALNFSGCCVAVDPEAVSVASNVGAAGHLNSLVVGGKMDATKMHGVPLELQVRFGVSCFYCASCVSYGFLLRITLTAISR